MYDDYYAEYGKEMEKRLMNGERKIPKPDVWITVKLLEERDISPWEVGKVKYLLSELQEKEEYNFIEAIMETIYIILKNANK